MVLPPLALGSRCLFLALTSRGQLVALLRDATLAVWDINAVSCIVQTSLQRLCQPTEVELLELRPKTGEPFLLLRDGRLLLFQRDLQSWTALTEARGLASLPRPGSTAPRPVVASTGDEPHLESDLLVAACLDDAEELRERLQVLVLHYGGRDPARLRSWCAALLGRRVGAAGAWAWLSAQLAGMGLEGKELLREVVIPSLGPGLGPNAHELRSELEEVLAPAKLSSAF
mmetsp:Transcript_23191/g.65794  ORF Transcript_23191/g.65794 Transcript_23191/m.65794 type:complete len:229 (+) Transcript_23191:281-967(+)